MSDDAIFGEGAAGTTDVDTDAIDADADVIDADAQLPMLWNFFGLIVTLFVASLVL